MSIEFVARGLALVVTICAVIGCATPAPGPEVTSPHPPTPEIARADPTRPELAHAALREELLAAGVRPLDDDELGFYMDIQEGRLRQKLGPAGVTVSRVAQAIDLELPDHLSFDANSGQLSSAVRPLMAELARVLREYDRSLVSLVGHTDDSGTDQYNQLLSERRALALARFLVDQGVAFNRLLVWGRGEGEPVAANDSNQGRQRNRRVEIRIEPLSP